MDCDKLKQDEHCCSICIEEGEDGDCQNCPNKDNHECQNCPENYK